MRDVLEALAAGELTVAEAEAALAGYATTGAGRFDAARERRRGVPEGILAAGKEPAEVGELAVAAVETTGRALVTRADDDDVAAVETALDADGRDVVRADSGAVVDEDAATDASAGETAADDAIAADDATASASEGASADATAVDDAACTVEYDDRSGVLVVESPDFEPPPLAATVAFVSGGTADAAAMGEARATCEAMGASTTTVEDVGVAHLGRVLDHLEALRAADALVVAAGREGALPTVVAGLVDTPVIGLPVSTGYGVGGDGEAALSGMLQSCTVLSVVNVDAGFVAGAQAGLIARAVADARAE